MAELFDISVVVFLEHGLHSTIGGLIDGSLAKMDGAGLGWRI